MAGPGISIRNVETDLSTRVCKWTEVSSERYEGVINNVSKYDRYEFMINLILDRQPVKAL